MHRRLKFLGGRTAFAAAPFIHVYVLLIMSVGTTNACHDIETGEPRAAMI